MAIHEFTSSLQIGSALVELPIIVNYEYCERKQAIREAGGLAISPEEAEHIEIQAIRVMVEPPGFHNNFHYPPMYVDLTRLLNFMGPENIAEIEREILESYR